MDHYEASLLQELDFKNEVVNLERTRENFRGYPYLHLPRTYLMQSGPRTIVMEYVKGDKITDLEVLK